VSWGSKLRHGVGADFENDLMRSFSKTPTCSLNFDLNFPEFPNSEDGDLKLRLLVTGVEAQVEAQVGVELEVFETPYYLSTLRFRFFLGFLSFFFLFFFSYCLDSLMILFNLLHIIDE
jgi:hypothetical protein